MVRTSVSVLWDDLEEPDMEALASNDLDACFNGILRHIWCASGEVYNTEEISIFYRTRSQRPDTDPGYILDYTSDSRYGTGPSLKGQFIGVTFHRIEVLPVAYAIRSDFMDKNTHHLRSFAFQARASPSSAWITLDEQVKINDLIPAKSHFLGFVDTDEYFCEFRILQTGPSHTNYLSFNIAGLEIHGLVRRRS